jgi:hypothetical protein
MDENSPNLVTPILLYVAAGFFLGTPYQNAESRPNYHNGHKIYHMAVYIDQNIHKVYQHLPLQDLPK